VAAMSATRPAAKATIMMNSRSKEKEHSF